MKWPSTGKYFQLRTKRGKTIVHNLPCEKEKLKMVHIAIQRFVSSTSLKNDYSPVNGKIFMDYFLEKDLFWNLRQINQGLIVGSQ
jgi:hypothetical protein